MKTREQIESFAVELSRACEREGLTEKDVGLLMAEVCRRFKQRHGPGKVKHPAGHMVHPHEMPVVEEPEDELDDDETETGEPGAATETGEPGVAINADEGPDAVPKTGV